MLSRSVLLLGLPGARERSSASGATLRTTYNRVRNVQALEVGGDDVGAEDISADDDSDDADDGDDDCGLDMGLTPERARGRAAHAAAAAGMQASVTSPTALQFDGRPHAQRTPPPSAPAPAHLERPRRQAAAQVLFLRVTSLPL